MNPSVNEAQGVTVWNREEIFHKGSDFFDHLEEEIKNAKRSIDIETYIFGDDEFGRHFIELLCEVARRGVAIRIMVDGVGSPSFLANHSKRLVELGAEVRIFNPTPWDLSLLSFRFFPGFSRLLQFFGSINRRNHRKVVIVDQKSVWTGGMNLCAQQNEHYYSDAWRDTGIRIEGPEIAEFMRAFEIAWRHAWSPIPQKRTLKYYWLRYRLRKNHRQQNLVRFNYTRALRLARYQELLNMIYHAQRRIWITNAYFVPDWSLVRALRSAGHSGVDVKIIVPFKSDIFFIRWVASAFYFSLLRAGVRIFEYQPRILHAKVILIDEWGTVGSSNLNHRSLIHDLEVDVVVTTEAGISSLDGQFRKDLSECREVTMEDWKNRPILERVLGQALLVLKYWF